MSQMRMILRRLPGLVLLLGLGAASLAWARAGGGEHYSGGGHSSSGGHSSDGDWGFVFEILYWLVRLAIEYPKVGVPLLVIVGVLVIVAMNEWQKAPAGPVRRLERARRRMPDPAEALRQIASRDPAFGTLAMEQRASRVFEEIQAAWFERRLASARHLMSDGLYRRFTTLQGLMEREGRRDATADVQVRRARVATAAVNGRLDVVTVRIEASLRDAEVDAGLSDAEARAKASKARLEPFSEYWTFIRSVDAKTVRGHDLVEGQCPNCGAPFAGGAANTCSYCSAVVNSGRYDWVLAEITQESEFVPGGGAAPGLAALQASDPEAAREVLEDRALLLFWKWLEAFAKADARGLQKVARPTVMEAVGTELERFRSQGSAPVLRTPAVGGADVVAVDQDVEGFDRVHVDVRWSGTAALESFDTLGRTTKRPRRHVLVMVRKSGATSASNGLATERCGQCCAPLSDADRTTCEYCGSDFSAGEQDWVLSRIVPYEAWRRPVARPALERTAPGAFSTRSERTRLLLLLASVARADGVIDARELAVLKKCARRWGVPWAEVEPVIAAERAHYADALLSSMAPEQQGEIFAALVEIVRADGTIHAKERRALVTAGLHMGLDKEDVEQRLAGN